MERPTREKSSDLSAAPTPAGPHGEAEQSLAAGSAAHPAHYPVEQEEHEATQWDTERGGLLATRANGRGRVSNRGRLRISVDDHEANETVAEDGHGWTQSQNWGAREWKDPIWSIAGSGTGGDDQEQKRERRGAIGQGILVGSRAADSFSARIDRVQR
jgi:hypothetical protein